jgi:hypothetical protein
MRPMNGWHRVLRPFMCEGGMIFEPRVNYSAQDIERFRTEWLNDL